MLRRSTRSMRKSPSPSSNAESQPTKRSRSSFKEEKSIKSSKKGKSKSKFEDSSSSESDIEDYLQPIEKIDLNSSFFEVEKSKDVPSFDKIEKEIFSGITVTRLSDSDTSSDDENTEKPTKPAITISPEIVPKLDIDEEKIKQSLREEEKVARLNLQKLQDYTRKIEEAKRSVEEYNARNAQGEKKEQTKVAETIDVEELLAAGEGKQSGNDSEINKSALSLHSSSFEEYDSEEEDWEEIKETQENKPKDLVPQKELEITVEMPTTMKKKRGDDLLMAVKRRLNRRKKENQLLIHKVHLLCWIAHGNYVNSVLNDQSMMALGLSLIPSEKCYPSGRLDLNYLEQILKWYRRTIHLSEKIPPKSKSLIDVLTEQMDKKEAYTKKMLVLIFIIVLRSLGIQSRLVVSFQVEPLRPSNSDLHFLGNSDSKSKKGDNSKIFKPIEGNISNDTKHSNNEKSKKSISAKEILVKRADIVSGQTTKVENISKGAVNSNKSNKETKKTSKTSVDLENKEKKLNTRDNKSVNLSRLTKTDKKDTKNKEQSRTKNHNENIIKSDLKEKRNKDQSKVTKDVNLKSSSRSKKTTSSNEKQSIDVIKKPANNLPVEKQTRQRSKTKKMTEESDQTVRSKSLVVNLDKLDIQSKTRSKSTSSKQDNKFEKKLKISQLDGSDDTLEDFKGFEKKQADGMFSDGSSFEVFYSQMYSQISQNLQDETLRIPQLDGTSDTPSTSKPNLTKLKSSSSSKNDNCKSERHKRTSKKPNYKDGRSDSDDCFEESPTKKFKSDQKDTKKPNLRKLRDVRQKKVESGKNTGDVTKDIMQLIKDRIAEQKRLDRSKMVKKRKSSKNDESEDSDYVPEPIKKKYHSDSDNDFSPKMKIKQRVQVAKKEKVKKLKKPKDPNSRKVISSDSEYTEEEKEKDKKKTKKRRGNDTWLEVFLETEEKWISVDVVFGQVHCVNELYSRASHPVSYVVAWNNDNYLKDITKRYCQNYNTVTRKLRIDSQWWEESLKPFVGVKNARDREEDDEFERQQLEKPLPTAISEYKNHPLYALERHLLKFEVIYPPNAPPLGFVRNEPVYSRECVHVCHSREIWLKEAKVVKLGEKPYKIVKARPKYDRLSNKMITDQLLEIFGVWQVEDYDPPAAENGIVPRNAFGNVDLFKPSMLPKKCVHLQLPGLNKVAKKMNIDCPSAIIGFDFHCGWSHPVYDGFVVCEEFEDQLVAAWNIEQEETERKEQEKYEKRVYGNWKKLIKGLLIKERLKAKYGFGDVDKEESSSTGAKKKTKKGPSFCTKKRRIMSDSSESDDDHK